MTYSLGLVPEATRQTATWWKLMPGVIAWLRAAYPGDDFIGSLTAKAESAGPVFIGTTGDGSRMFFVDADRHGSYAIPGVKYAAPGGADARPLAYEAVRAVFAVAPDTDPSTKPMLATSSIIIDAPNRPSTKWPLYVGLGLSGLLLVGGIAYAMTRKKAAPAPAALAENRRRARRVRRNGPSDYEPRFAEDFGQEGSAEDYQRAAAAVGRGSLARARADRLRALSDAESLRDPRPRSSAAWRKRGKAYEGYIDDLRDEGQEFINRGFR